VSAGNHRQRHYEATFHPGDCNWDHDFDPTPGECANLNGLKRLRRLPSPGTPVRHRGGGGSCCGRGRFGAGRVPQLHRRGGNFRLQGTAGQPAIGRLSGVNSLLEMGY